MPIGDAVSLVGGAIVKILMLIQLSVRSESDYIVMLESCGEIIILKLAGRAFPFLLPLSGPRKELRQIGAPFLRIT
jgi:hypothetical protein